MGLILDTSSIVTSERRGLTVSEILERIQAVAGDADVGVSAITITEMTHGIERAKTDAQRQKREAFVRELRSAVRVYPVTDEIAELAGRISGQAAEHGVVLALADLLIGATALYCGFEVMTENLRHFKMIPHLIVRKL